MILKTEIIKDIRQGFETAYINGTLASNLEYKPSFVSNNPKEGKKVISTIEEELLRCEHFQISVAFITMGGITPLLQTLKELERKGVVGEILTTNYLNFSEPRALEKLNELSNITLKMYDVEVADSGFHTKGYIFKKEEVYRIILGTPDKRDDYIEGRNVYELFNHQIAHEIRLQKAMEDDLLCPFHYFGISDIAMLNDKTFKGKIITEKDFNLLTIIDDCKQRYSYEITNEKIDAACEVLKGTFVTNSSEREKFCRINILKSDGKDYLERILSYAEKLMHKDFYNQIQDIVEVGLARYKDKYSKPYRQKCPFVLYEKYSRRDVSLLMNAGKDLSSTMYGMSQLGDDVFIFVTYHKEENTDEEKQYVDGKPDYADEFVDNVIFRWDSQIDKKLDGAYMNKVLNTPRKHLFVQKTDAENNFFYMGEFDVLDAYEEEKKNNRGLMKPICKLKFRMHTAVREDLLRYLQSGNEMEKEAI